MVRPRDADLRDSVFARRLLSSLEAEPLEDGVSHAAEGLIEAALCDVSTEIASRIYETLRELTLDPEHPAMCGGRAALLGATGATRHEVVASRSDM